MKKTVPLLLMMLLCLLVVPVEAVELPLAAPEALLMEKSTGQVLYAKNEHEQREPASVTKIMTLLLTMEAIDEGRLHYDDMVTVSAYAASMGGSQVYLKENEQISVEELLKAVCVSSGNDAAVALAEKVAGVTELFVEQMNNRAGELGMNDTHFANCTGLPAEGHVTSAYDIALMSRELILKHPDIRRFTTIWMDTIRGGSFGLSNTNKLIRFYDGATGLKTGSTSSAGFCISATAERDGMELIAVIMKGETSASRNEDAKALLNYGFSTYALTDITPGEPLPELPVVLGEADTVPLTLAGDSAVLTEKSHAAGLRQELKLPESVEAPVEQGAQIGTLTVYDGDTALAEVPIAAAQAVGKLTWSQMTERLLRMALLAK
ncbi:MAG: D-alanyl-D-alanine carboxypeptidase [Clostridiales bacterium]|nr:D-alanyl-D-alanine carboxypeptidase [Candidatus Cacconaster stercorequi]